jgi:hypothetical protein
LGRDAAAFVPVLAAFKQKHGSYAFWVDRILAGMK